MSANPYGGSYQNYGGNPYGSEQQQQYGGYGSGNPYDAPNTNIEPGQMRHQQSAYSQTSGYSLPQAPQPAMPGQPPQPGQNVQYVQAGPSVMSNSDFLSRVEAAKADIRTLTNHVGQIASMHQRTLSAPDSGSSSQLESMITQTQVLNTSIRDQIKFIETDAVRSKGNTVKDTQVTQLKTSFQKQLQEYRVEEANYEKRYREQIARQYRIVNPDATEAEVIEATQADWGNEGVFQTALKTNRSATANTVLGAVRARHNDIQKIERTMMELNALMEDLATAVVLQEQPIVDAEVHTGNVKNDTEAGNKQLDQGIKSARNTRKLKWWCLLIVVLIIAIIALVLGLYFGLHKNTGN